MTGHNLYYYPYAQFGDEQTPLLKMAALYFDQLYLLDPTEASSMTLGVSPEANKGLEAIAKSKKGLIKRLEPGAVIEQLGDLISKAIAFDLNDRGFMSLCEDHARRTGRHLWTLGLAKLPNNQPRDAKLRAFLQEYTWKVAADASNRPLLRDIVEDRAAIASIGARSEFDEAFPDDQLVRDFAFYAEQRGDYTEVAPDGVEYRYVTAPLALGASVMVNHALFGGLLHVDATPVTDDDFHASILQYKLARAREHPELRDILNARIKAQGLKADAVALAAFKDPMIDLPILHPATPMEAVLEFRDRHEDALEKARTALAWAAREMETELWTAEFEKELDHKTLPKLNKDLEDARKALDAWGKTAKARTAVRAVVGGAAVVSAALTIMAAPVMPVPVAIMSVAAAGAGALSGAGGPIGDAVIDWIEGKKEARQNGLHYLVKYTGK